MARTGPTIRKRQVEAVLEEWPAAAADAATAIMDRYGAPDRVTSEWLCWYENGPWKRTLVYRDGVPHEFPEPHVDHVEQVIDYHVPPRYYDAIGRFHGSVTPRRTRGELCVECKDEPQNVLALNLVHDVVTEQKSVTEARDLFTEAYAKLVAGGNPEYTQGLQFDLPRDDQRDPGRSTLSNGIMRRAEWQLE